MKKKIRFIARTIIVFTFVIIIYTLFSSKPDLDISKDQKVGNEIALYKDDGFGYQAYGSSSFPSDGYNLNLEKSFCTSGELSQKIRV